MSLRVGALCAGYGGIEQGLASVTDVDLAWYAEYDDAPAAIMAHHHPGVTNHRDVTTIRWDDLEPVDVLTAGYPCQPFSHAGKRQGEDDPRHLWPHIARGIATLRPPLCVFENVRGHLSLGFDKVLHDLHRLDYDVRWYLLRAADVGAAHGRARLFIFATDRSTVPPADPWATPVAVAGEDGWLEPESHLFGQSPFAGSLPPCGRMVEGHLYAEPRWLAREDGSPLLPTPTVQDGSNTGGASQFERNSLPLNALVTLLPTPAVNDMGEGKTPDAWDAWDAWTERMRAAHGNGNGHGKSLAIEAQRMLLPTPRTQNNENRQSERYGGDRGNFHGLLTGAVSWGDYAPAIARWETVTGRPAPAPTEPNAKGAHRLAPRFVEWLMGLPEGWVCDVPGLTRNNQLKALGNGVVPQQAAAAYRAFLADTKKEAAA